MPARPDEAAALSVEANAIDGPRPAIRLALGEALIRTGRAEAVDSNLGSRSSHRLLVGNAVRRLSGMADSVAGTSVESALDFGTLALEQNALREAIRWLQIAVQRAPDRAEAHEKLGLAIFLNGDPPTARPYLERACRLDPGSASAHLNLAAVYAELGRFLRPGVRRSKRFGSIPPRRAPRLSSKPSRSSFIRLE